MAASATDRANLSNFATAIPLTCPLSTLSSAFTNSGRSARDPDSSRSVSQPTIRWPLAFANASIFSCCTFGLMNESPSRPFTLLTRM